jgi:hypothetical protein
MISQILPAYLYQQYLGGLAPPAYTNGESAIAGFAIAGEAVAGANSLTQPVPYIQSFFTAYNNTAQGYLDQVNNLNLPIYTQLSYPLLDWVGNSLYGFSRPTLTLNNIQLVGGVYNSDLYDTQVYDGVDIKINGISITGLTWTNGVVTVTTSTPIGVPTGVQFIGYIYGCVPIAYNGLFQCTQTGTNTFTYNLLNNPGSETTLGIVQLSAESVSDDIYQRCITWNFYKGDGFQFNINWLKRRIIRFLTGANGVAPAIDNTYNVSVTFNPGNNVYINIPNTFESSVAIYLASALNAGVLQLPFQYIFTIAY